MNAHIVNIQHFTNGDIGLEFVDEDDDVIQFIMSPKKAKRVAYEILTCIAHDEEASE